MPTTGEAGDDVAQPERHKPGQPLRIGGWLPHPRRATSDRPRPATDDDDEAHRPAPAFRQPTPAFRQPPMAAPPEPPDPAAGIDDSPSIWSIDPRDGQPSRTRPRRTARWARLAAPAAALILVGVVVGVTRLVAANSPSDRPDHDLARSSAPFQPLPEPQPRGESRSETTEDAMSIASAGSSPSQPAANHSTEAKSPTSTRSGTPTVTRSTARSIPPKPTPVSYQAEAAHRIGSTQVQNVTSAAGGKVVAFGWYGAIEFVVPSATARDSRITIAYLSTERRAAVLRTNNDPEVPLRFPPTAGTSRVATMTVDVRLAAGDNLLRFGTGWYLGPALDMITVG